MVPLATVPFEKMSKKLISSNKTNIDLSHQIGCIFCEKSFDEFVPTIFFPDFRALCAVEQSIQWGLYIWRGLKRKQVLLQKNKLDFSFIQQREQMSDN